MNKIHFEQSYLEILYFDLVANVFKLGFDNATVQVVQNGQFDYSLHLLDAEKNAIHSEPITTHRIGYIDPQIVGYIWNTVIQQVSTSLAIKFPNMKDTKAFHSIIFSVYNSVTSRRNLDTAKEETTQMSWYASKLKPREDSEDESESEEEETEEEDEDESGDETDSEESNVEDINQITPRSQRVNTNFVNDQLGRTFLGVDGVFNVVGEVKGTPSVVSQFTLKKVKGKVIRPRQACYSSQHNKIFILDRDNPKDVLIYDIEKETVLDQGTFKADIKDLSTDQVSGESGNIIKMISDCSIIGVDDRVGIKSDSNMTRDYKSVSGFSTIISGGEKSYVVGDNLGAIRTYDNFGSNARTLTAGFGQKLRYLDISCNGDYLVGTGSTHLVLFTIRDKEGRSFFDKKILLKDRMAPVMLTLKPKDWSWLGEDAEFSKATFGPSGTDSHIISNIGNFIIRWNMRMIKQGKYTDYSIEEFSEEIDSDIYMANDRRTIIATTDNRIFNTTLSGKSKKSAKKEKETPKILNPFLKK